MPVLYAVALLLGALPVPHQAASTAIVPEIVDRSRTHPANARIAGAFSLADVAGIYGGTLVVGLLGAVRALGRDLVGGLEAIASAIRIGSPDSSGTRGRPRACAKGPVRQADGR
ncbi:MFS transporter [Streptomyces eurythermus]|uniref:hypothetical protein n=1 Tax=Streptomyces eurythermus TaxID=42237 RepID=UPI0036FDA560